MKLIRKSALSGATCLQSAAIAAALLGFAGSTTAFAQILLKNFPLQCW